MANYGFIYTAIAVPAAVEALSAVAADIFGDRLRVRIHESGLIIVEAPGTGSDDPKKARRLWLATGEDACFSVEVDPTWEERQCLAFRSGPVPSWLDWMRGCIEEGMSDRLGLPIVYDATGEARGPGSRVYRQGATFREYMTARFGGSLSDEDERHLRPHFAICPAQFLEVR